MDGKVSEMASQTLRNNVREQRKAAGMTLEDLSSASGVGTTAIKAIEAGHAPTPTVQAKLAAALGLRVEDVFVWSEPATAVPA